MPAMPKLTQDGLATGRRGGRNGELTEVARADALRILMGDGMMREIARVGRFRVIANEPLAPTAADPRGARRLFGIDIVDYNSDRSVTACVDLDRGDVASLRCGPALPRLAPEEEAEALSVALADRRVAEGIRLGDAPRSILHVGSRTAGEDGPPHRAAVVVFGAPKGPATLIAIVDLARGAVTAILPPEQFQG